jgi:hypothetical protein
MGWVSWIELVQPPTASSIFRAPAPPSSAGWNTSRTVPRSCPSIALSTEA